MFYIINDSDRPCVDLLVYKDKNGCGHYLFNRNPEEVLMIIKGLGK